MCDYQVFLRPVSGPEGHSHEACIDKSKYGRFLSSESEGHVHELEMENGVVRQTQEDIEKTGHEHPILTIAHYREPTFWEKYGKWILAALVLIALYFWISASPSETPTRSKRNRRPDRRQSSENRLIADLLSKLESME